MSKRLRHRHGTMAAVSFIIALLLVMPLSFPYSLDAAYAQTAEGRVVVELQGQSSAISHAGRSIKGTDNLNKQLYKFQRERYGTDFHYALSGLSRSSYNIEFSFFEPVYGPGQRVFSVYANGSPTPLTGLSNLDIASKVGLNTAYQVTVQGVPAPGGTLDLRFKASKKEATICNIRLIAAGKTAAEINVLETRHWSAKPLRFVNGEGQDLHEVILGRFGSRFMVNPAPQLLAWRQSPLGTWTDDLSELVMAFRDAQGDIRCLPFTDRYPVFSAIDQNLTLTGVSYTCQDPGLPFRATVTLRAPFYPGDAKLSGAPFFYLDVEVSNPSGSAVPAEFMLVRPHKDANTGADAPVQLTGAFNSGYKFKTNYTYSDESRVLPPPAGTSAGYYTFWEGIAWNDASGITPHYADISDAGWIWNSPPGYPPPYSHQVYTFMPKGYSGVEWSVNLPSAGKARRTFVLAGHTPSAVLNVRGDNSYRFLYNRPAGPNLTSVDAVVDYALGERASILEKSDFFDGILSEQYISSLSQAGRELAAVALQNFICNAWWCYNSGGQEWFSVWEGEPYMYHSSVDVEYTNAWFYLSFWPELLKKLLEEWTVFEKESQQGKYVSHDMGVEHWITGMAYPHDMPVEENADYILLLYSHWKTTGDTAFMRGLYPKAKDYARFIFNCDSDGDGLPDLNVSNTIDQGSEAVQHARNQTYLGVKALGAYRAASEMALAQEAPDADFSSACEARVRLINLTLENKLWLGDHFAVCDDPAVPQAEREAYSLYASNGLLYLLAAGLDPGLTQANLERFRLDLANAAARTQRRYGHVHTSLNNENQWVSQNLWRDALGYWLGVEGWPQGQQERLSRYWDLQRYFAVKKNGGFWDVCAYNPGREERFGSMRGAFLPDHALDQSLGYYSRGAALLALPAAMARLRLDRVSGYLVYDPAHAPGRVPVFSCADWGAEDPEKRIPVLLFDAAGGLAEAVNPQLLPGRLLASP